MQNSVRDGPIWNLSYLPHQAGVGPEAEDTDELAEDKPTDVGLEVLVVEGATASSSKSSEAG